MKKDNKKIVLKDFFESDKKLAIHCDTEEKANILLKVFDKLGKKWCSGVSYLEDNNWETSKEETCYSNKGAYCTKEFYLNKNYKVYEFEDVILKEYLNDNVKKVFEILGVEPGEAFKIQDAFNKSDGNKYYFARNLDTYRIKNDGIKEFYSELEVLRIIKGIHTIIKFPKKKKLRDLTLEEYKKWEGTYCPKIACENCPFYTLSCNSLSDCCWVSHKDLFSDKFLDQEVEIPQEEE